MVRVLGAESPVLESKVCLDTSLFLFLKPGEYEYKPYIDRPPYQRGLGRGFIA